MEGEVGHQEHHDHHENEHVHQDHEEEEHTHYHGVDRAEAHIGVSQALSMLLGNIALLRKPATILLSDSSGRILFEDIRSPTNLPAIARSTRDGYAVNITQSVEAGKSFKIVGDVRIGIVPKLSVKPGEAVRIATGSYVPDGANSVVMVEYTHLERGKSVRVDRTIRIQDNILGPGEDLSHGQLLFTKGTKIHPQLIALLSMFGTRHVKVFPKPRVAFFSTGDELTDSRPPGWTATTTAKKKMKTKGGRETEAEEEGNSSKLRIYDANRPFMASMISDLGAEPIDLGIARDNLNQIRSRMLRGLKYDALILSAGSSVGERDFVTKAADSIPGMRILVHGVAMRPSSPTGLATYKRTKPVILLPGFPTSAIVSFLVFARPAILKLSGNSSIEPPVIKARFLDEYSAKTGLTHFVRVRVTKEKQDGGGGDRRYVAKIARPTEAYYSSWLKEANGIAIIGENRGIINPNDEVDVFLIGEV